jgi:hypothetical protein
MLIQVRVKEIVETLRAFFFEDDGAGEESVAEAVAGGVEFALIGEGALGAGSIGSGGCDLFVGGHGYFPKTFWPRRDAKGRELGAKVTEGGRVAVS